MTKSDHQPGRQTFVWRGLLDSTLVHDHVVAASHRLADAAKAGEWAIVLHMLDDPTQHVDVNWWRPGGTAWFTVLHQAAWHAAPLDVIDGLVRRGALRTLVDSKGRAASDVLTDRELELSPATSATAGQRLRTARARRLAPPPSPCSADEMSSLEGHLAEVIDGRLRGAFFDGRNPREVLRYPPVGILHEVPDQHLWFPVPGMYGGFDITLRNGFLDVKSWSRVVGGSGQQHVITTAGAILVDEGFA